MNDNRYDELNPAAKNMIDRLINTIASSGEECEFPMLSNRPKGNGERIYTILDVATIAIQYKMDVTRFPKRDKFRYYKIEEAKKVTA